MEREVRYCTTEDGVRIAYTTPGEGAPFVFAANAWGDTDIFTQSPLCGPLPELVRESGHKAVSYEGRGAGQSDRGSSWRRRGGMRYDAQTEHSCSAHPTSASG